ncbi:hypothetical protein FQA39_LY18783 [Lamprigera yunnana]|nr:hypothetical protein FQA39_LY18783 [Lamprigera yunnana]
MSAAVLDAVNKTEIQSAVLQLKSLIKCDAKLSQYEYDEYFLTRFLYASKFRTIIALKLVCTIVINIFGYETTNK